MEKILSPDYWKVRLQSVSPENIHQAVFRCPLDRWERIEVKHKDILEKHIQPKDTILDCGCAWGRLLDLLPVSWGGEYVGVDLSPDFIALAEERYKSHHRFPIFIQGDLRNLGSNRTGLFEWGILCSIRPMVKRHLGDVVWQQMEAEIRKHCKKLLYLEYDETDEGLVE